MSLISSSTQVHNIGLRNLSMWNTVGEVISQDMADDPSVQKWREALETDPLFRLGRFALDESKFYLKTAVSTATALTSTVLSPITKPLSYFIKPEVYKLTPPPFGLSNIKISTKNYDLQLYQGNLYERFLNRLVNINNYFAVTNNPIIKYPYQAARSALEIPLRFFGEPSKEELVMASIRLYYPRFNQVQFADWLEHSFLPITLNRYIRGNGLLMRETCATKVVTERMTSVSDYMASGLLIMSKLLKVYNVQIANYEFVDRKPQIAVVCAVDHTEDIRTSHDRQIVIGGPDSLRRSQFNIIISIDTTGANPKWQVTDIQLAQTSTRV